MAAGTESSTPATQTREAFQELLNVLRDIDARFLGPEWGNADRVPEGHRYVTHLLLSGLELFAEADLERPVFCRFVSPTKKFFGDNPDAIYYTAFIRPDRGYRIRGNTAGAVYTSLSLELGTNEGGFSQRTALAISDKDLKVAADGSYEVILSPDKRPGNWFKLDPEVGSITTRHYFEQERPVAADPTTVIPLSIEPLDPLGPRPPADAASIALGLRRVATYLRSRTVDRPPFMQAGQVPSWVSIVPNQFNPPELPKGDVGFTLLDAAYAMAPYYLNPEQALVIEGRFPKCCFANVNLWNHFMQTYDYATRQVSRNRKQTILERDGSFRMVLAHRNPGVPNWLDTEGRLSGIIYWRFLLPEEPIAPLKTQVVEFSKIAKS